MKQTAAPERERTGEKAREKNAPKQRCMRNMSLLVNIHLFKHYKHISLNLPLHFYCIVTLNQITWLYIYLEFHSMWNDFGRRGEEEGEQKERGATREKIETKREARSTPTHTVRCNVLKHISIELCLLPEGRNEWLLLIRVVYTGVRCRQMDIHKF